MAESADPLMLEFLSWISNRRRTYAEAMNAWQSTCPRHTIWEDAITDGLVQRNRAATLHDPEVTLTPRGKAYLDRNTSHRWTCDLVPSVIHRKLL